MLKLSRDEKASIRHALMHKVNFFKRNIKALALLKELCEGKGTSKGD